MATISAIIDINPTSNRDPVTIILYISDLLLGANIINNIYTHTVNIEFTKYNNVACADCFFTNSFLLSVRYIIKGIAQAK
jgi:hypothetical protein